jgi:acetyl esterase
MWTSVPEHRAAWLLVTAGLAGLIVSCDRTGTKDGAPTGAPPSVAASPELRSGNIDVGAASSLTPSKDPLTVADRDMQRLLLELDTMGRRPIHRLSVEEARRQPTLLDAARSLSRKEGRRDAIDMAKVEDRKIPRPAGPLMARVYTPRPDDKSESKDRAEKKPAARTPVILYWHGGGFVLGDVATYDATARVLAKGTGAIVVSAEYRRAPEHAFPAAHDDAVAAYDWVLSNAPSFGGDPSRIAIAGEGAGANLATHVALTARERGTQQPVHQLLVHPIAQASTNTRSYTEWANARPLDRQAMIWCFETVLRSARDRHDSRISLVDAPLRGLPSTTLILAEIDPLWSDGEALYLGLASAGVDVERKTYAGMTHDFFGTGAVVNAARDAEAYAADRLKRALAR